MDDQLDQRTTQRERIDAVMRGKALVLVSEQQIEKAGVHILARGGNPPSTFRCRIGPQQIAPAVHDKRGEHEPLPDRRGAEGRNPGCGRPYRRACREGKEDGADANQSPPTPDADTPPPLGHKH